MPYLLLHGKEDKICSVEGSKAFHKFSSSEDKTIDIVEAGRHHLYIETENIRRKAINTTFEWIENRVQ